MTDIFDVPTGEPERVPPIIEPQPGMTPGDIREEVLAKLVDQAVEVEPLTFRQRMERRVDSFVYGFFRITDEVEIEQQ